MSNDEESTDEETTDEASTEPADAEPAEAGPPRAHRTAVYVLTVLGAIVLLVTSVNVWVDRAALNTDNWVEASDELIADPQVREAVSAYVVDELYANVDVSAELGQLLPGDLERLAAPLAAALRTPATDAIDRLLATQQAAEIWSTANRVTHENLVKVLKDQGTIVSTADGVVTLDLRQLVIELATTIGLSQSVIDRIPQNIGQLEVVQSDTLEDLQTAVAFVEWASVLLFFVVLGIFAAAIALATDWRRVAIRNIGIAIAIVGLLITAGLRFGGSRLLDSVVKNESNRAAADAVWRIGSSLLRDLGLNLIAVGVIVVIGAALAGSGRAAQAIRHAISPAFVGTSGVHWVIGVVVWLVLVWLAPLPVLEVWWGILLCAVIVGLCVEGLRRLCLADAQRAESLASV